MHTVDSVRARLDALALGEGGLGQVDASLLRRLARAVSVPIVLGRARRTVSLPDDAQPLTVAVGGASLGGSGKTPVAIACARVLAEHGVPTALVGHGYRSRTGRAFVVDPSTHVDRCGDEGKVAEAALRGLPQVCVVVGPSRAEATQFASKFARVLVLDGPLETRPTRATLTLLALADEDIGRLSRTLGRFVDAVVPTGREAGAVHLIAGDGRATTLGSLAGLRYGLVTAIARPGRAVVALGSHRPTVHLRLGNHGTLDAATEARAMELGRELRLDQWIATEKGPLLGRSTFAGLPLRALRHAVSLPPSVHAALEAVATRAHPLMADGAAASPSHAHP